MAGNSRRRWSRVARPGTAPSGARSATATDPGMTKPDVDSRRPGRRLRAATCGRLDRYSLGGSYVRVHLQALRAALLQCLVDGPTRPLRRVRRRTRADRGERGARRGLQPSPAACRRSPATARRWPRRPTAARAAAVTAWGWARTRTPPGPTVADRPSPHERTEL